MAKPVLDWVQELKRIKHKRDDEMKRRKNGFEEELENELKSPLTEQEFKRLSNTKIKGGIYRGATVIELIEKDPMYADCWFNQSLIDMTPQRKKEWFLYRKFIKALNEI